MTTMTLELPDSVEAERNDVLRMIAARLYERRTLSLSEAARLAKMPKWEFAEILADYGVAYFNQTRSELEEEVKNA
jgi:predicted HTH domain antitoxin